MLKILSVRSLLGVCLAGPAHRRATCFSRSQGCKGWATVYRSSQAAPFAIRKDGMKGRASAEWLKAIRSEEEGPFPKGSKKV